MWGSRLTLVVTLVVMLAATREEEEVVFLPARGGRVSERPVDGRALHLTRSEDSSVPKRAQTGDDSLDDGVRSEQSILYRRLEEVLSVLGESGDIGQPVEQQLSASAFDRRDISGRTSS
jgi:hypothetical protein